MEVSNGHIKRVVDHEVKSLVLEICGTNVATTYIYSPANEKGSLGIRLPFFVMVIKNLKRYFSFEIEIMDDRRNRRRFRVSNYQSQTAVHTFTCHMPLGLNPGWNQVQFNLADFTRKAYGSSYMETRRVQIHANCRIRCVYFADKIYSEDELPPEFKLFMPIGEKRSKTDKKGAKKKDSKISAKDKSDEVSGTEEGKEEEAPEEGEGPQQQAKAILDMITDLVMDKIANMPEGGKAKPEEGAAQQEPPAEPQDEAAEPPSADQPPAEGQETPKAEEVPAGEAAPEGGAPPAEGTAPAEEAAPAGEAAPVEAAA